jgi:hypothetical protein
VMMGGMLAGHDQSGGEVIEKNGRKVSLPVADCDFTAVLRSRIRIRIHMFLGLPDPDPLVRGLDPALDPDPDPSIIMQKY